MADKRISQLVERVDIANNDVLPIVASGATTTNKVTISTLQDWMQDNIDVGVSSVGITLGTIGNDVSVSGSPITTSGNITINIPSASSTARGLVTTVAQTFAGEKTFANGLSLLPAGGANQVSRFFNIGTIHQGTAGFNQIGFNNSNNIYFGKGLDNGGVIQWNNAAVRYYTLQDADGTLAFTSQLDGYVTLNTAQIITAQKTFTTSGSTDSVIISHGSGSGIALDVIKAGSGQAIRVQKTSGSGDAVTITGGLLSAEDATFSSDIIVNGVNIGRGPGDYTSNIRLGNTALSANTTGTGNSSLGTFSLQNNTTASNNTAIGYYAMQNNITGGNNTAVGLWALRYNTAGGRNTSVGDYSMLNNTTGSLNTAFGGNALSDNTTGEYNLALGTYALHKNTTGSYNIAIGNVAGSYTIPGDNTISNNSIFIGYLTEALANNQTNQIVIGHNAKGNGSNTVTIGNDSITSNIFSGNLSTRRAVGTASEGIIELRPNTGSSNIIIASGTVPLHILSTSGSLGLGVGSTPQLTIASGGAVTLTGALNGTSASFSGLVTSSNIINSSTLPNTPSNHSISLYPPTTTNYYGGGIGWSEGTNTAASINAYDDGGGGALGLVLSTGNNSTISPRLTISSTGAATFSNSTSGNALSLYTSYASGRQLNFGFSDGSVLPTAAFYIGNQTAVGVFIGDETTTNGLYVKANGNVGIGTASPASKLDVSGEIRSTSTSGYAALLSISALGYSILADTHTGGAMTIFTEGSEKMRITSDAYLRMASGTGGIQFNGDTAAANALDDYEEGTWTPTISGLNLSIQRATYVKIGSLVHIMGALGYSSGTGSGNIIGGLPFPANSTNRAGLSFGNMNGINWGSGATTPFGFIYESTIVCYGFANNSPYTTADFSSFGSGDFIEFSAVYSTS
jgi:hypothetical protein